MNKKIILAAYMLVLCSACKKDDAPGQRGEQGASASAVPEDCFYGGDNIDSHYCATTVFQLMSSPEKYDGKRISLLMWATNVGGVTLLFPSKDHLEEADTVSSIVVIPRSESSGGNDGNYGQDGKRIFIEGNFVLNKLGPDGKRKLSGLDMNRFGAMVDVDDSFLDKLKE